MRVVGKIIVGVFASIGVIASVVQLRGQSGSPMQGAVPVHVGIMVTNIENTSRRFEEVFGITVPPSREVGPLQFPTEVPGAARSKVKFVQFKIGDLMLELIEPVAGPGPHKDHIDRFGQGLQHIAFRVPDQKAAIQYLIGKGGTWTLANYVDLRDVLGFTAELSGPLRPQ